MKKLLTIFLMTIVASVPFSTNTLVADSHITNPSFDLQNDDVWNVRLNKLKDAGRGVLQEEELTKLAKYFISESEQLIVVNLRKECNRMPEYWADGLHGHFNQTTKNLEQNENECLREVLATIHVRIEDGEYQINQFNLATLQAITEGVFVSNFEHRYVRFQIADGFLLSDLFADQIFQYAHEFPTDVEIRVHYTEEQETTTTIICLLDPISSEDKLGFKEYISNYASQYASDCYIPSSEHASKQSPFVNSRSESNFIYNRLLCDYSYGVEGEISWGGNDGVKTDITVYGEVSDKDGNSAHGSYYYNSDGRTGVRGGVNREPERDRNR